MSVAMITASQKTVQAPTCGFFPASRTIHLPAMLRSRRHRLPTRLVCERFFVSSARTPRVLSVSVARRLRELRDTAVTRRAQSHADSRVAMQCGESDPGLAGSRAAVPTAKTTRRATALIGILLVSLTATCDASSGGCARRRGKTDSLRGGEQRGTAGGGSGIRWLRQVRHRRDRDVHALGRGCARHHPDDSGTAVRHSGCLTGFGPVIRPDAPLMGVAARGHPPGPPVAITMPRQIGASTIHPTSRQRVYIPKQMESMHS